jgi:hypothetical protein
MAMAAAALLMVGCGGGDGSGGTATTSGASGGGSGITRAYPTFNLNATGGIVQVNYLSGSDRRSRATGSLVAVIDNVEFLDETRDRIPDFPQGVPKALNIVLDTPVVNATELPVTFSSDLSSRTFTEFPFSIRKLQQIQSDGTAGDVLTDPSPILTSASPFDARVRVFPGRYTSVQVRLNEQMLTFDPSNPAGGLTFDEDKFTAANYDLRTRSIRGFISDYLSFDISGVSAAQRPPMSSGGFADRIHFSGDAIAISRGIGTTSTFELLDPVAIKSGVLRAGVQIGDRKAENTYTLNDTTSTGAAVAAMGGVWKEHTRMVNAAGDVTVIAFPNGDDDEAAGQQLIIYRESAGKVTAMWQGQVDYGTGGNPDGGVIKLFPISTVTSAVPSAAIATGTVSNLVRSNGMVVRGAWTLTGAIPAGWTFPTSGEFAVYRR